MEDAKGQAKEQFARLQRNVQPRLNQLQDRLQTVPDRLQSLPERLPNSFSLPRNQQSTLPPQPPPPPQQQQQQQQQPQHARTRSNPPDMSGVPLPQLSRAPVLSDPAYNHDLAALASKILYRSGSDPISGGPLLILCASAFPDANNVDYTVLLPYVLSNLPGDDELAGLDGGYSVIFFAGGSDKKSEPGSRPTWKWTLQAYTLVGVIREIAANRHDDDGEDVLKADARGGPQLGRVVRKKIRKLWVVHEKNWIRTILELMANVVSVKFKKKVVHLNTLSDLAAHVDITKLTIPPAVYLQDRRLSSEITLPWFPKAPIFGNHPFNSSSNPPRVGDNTPLPQVLVDTSSYIRRSCLTVQGLFRVPPSQALLEIARDCYDRHTSLPWEDWGPHTAAGLTKLYYRSLPIPMIPQECYEQMQSLVAIDPDPERVLPEEEMQEVRFEVVRALLTSPNSTLPNHSRILFLRHLLPLFSEVAANSQKNMMNATNLAVCIAASLVRSDDMMADAKASAGVRKFIEIGIERIDELAPKLPLRRAGGIVDSEKRRSRASLASIDDNQPMLRRRVPVPSLSMPTSQLQGKPVSPSTYSPSTDTRASPVQLSPPPPVHMEHNNRPHPQGPRPPPRKVRASSYDTTNPQPLAVPQALRSRPESNTSPFGISRSASLRRRPESAPPPLPQRPQSTLLPTLSPITRSISPQLPTLSPATGSVPPPPQQQQPTIWKSVPPPQQQQPILSPIRKSVPPPQQQPIFPPIRKSVPPPQQQQPTLPPIRKSVPPQQPTLPSTQSSVPLQQQPTPQPTLQPTLPPITGGIPSQEPTLTPTLRSALQQQPTPPPIVRSVSPQPISRNTHPHPTPTPPLLPPKPPTYIRQQSLPISALQSPFLSPSTIPGTFHRPVLRRVASANMVREGGERVVRRARSQVLGGDRGAVKELREIFEARSREERVERRGSVVERKGSWVVFGGGGGGVRRV